MVRRILGGREMDCCCGFRVFEGDSGLEMPCNGRERIAGSLVDLGDELGVIWEVLEVWIAVG